MKRRHKNVACFCLFILIFSLFFGCSSEENETGAGIAKTLEIVGVPQDNVFVLNDTNDSFSLACRIDPAEDAEFLWSSSDEDVLRTQAEGNRAKITAKSSGRAKITASLADGSLRSSVEIVVADERTAENVSTVRIVGAKYRAKIVEDRFILETVGGEDTEILFKSDNAQVASVSTEGEVTCLKEGLAILSAYLNENESACDSIVLSVTTSPHEYYKEETFDAATENLSDTFDFVSLWGAVEFSKERENGNSYLTVSRTTAGGWNGYGISASGLTVGKEYTFSMSLKILEGNYRCFAYQKNGFTLKNLATDKGNPNGNGFVKLADKEYVYVYTFVADASAYQFMFDSGEAGDGTFKIAIDDIRLGVREMTQGDCFV